MRQRAFPREDAGGEGSGQLPTTDTKGQLGEAEAGLFLEEESEGEPGWEEEGPEMSVEKLPSLAGGDKSTGRLLVFGVFLFFFSPIMQAGTACITCRALKYEH